MQSTFVSHTLPDCTAVHHDVSSRLIQQLCWKDDWNVPPRQDNAAITIAKIQQNKSKESADKCGDTPLIINIVVKYVKSINALQLN